jgi:hypothetical protein
MDGPIIKEFDNLQMLQIIKKFKRTFELLPAHRIL